MRARDVVDVAEADAADEVEAVGPLVLVRPEQLEQELLRRADKVAADSAAGAEARLVRRHE